MSALVSAHAAERHLLAARHAAARRLLLAEGGNAMLDGALAAIAARFADRRRQLATITSVAARAAAARQLEQEEREERNAVIRSMRLEQRRIRSTALKLLSAAQKAERHSLGMRQRRQRGMIAVALRQLRPRQSANREKGRRQFSARPSSPGGTRR